MSNKICINKSGVAVPVYDSHYNQIGKLNNREVFSFVANHGGDGVFNQIVFRNSAGESVIGYLYDDAVVDGVTYTLPDGVFTECIDYPYSTGEIINVTTAVNSDGVPLKKNVIFKTFKFRNKEEVFNAAGEHWGWVAAGMRVATNNSTAGDSMPLLKQITCVERSTDGEWVQVTGADCLYGYVNIGLEDGSNPNAISMYGSW